MLVVLLCLLVVLGGVALLRYLDCLTQGLSTFYQLLDDAAALRHRILDFGRLAPLVFLLLQIAQVLVAPLPGEASGVLGGYLFGTWTGFLLSSLGLALGSWLAFAVGRTGDRLLGRRLRRTKAWKQCNHLAVQKNFVIPFALFLLPGFPKDVLSYILGLTRIPVPVFLFVSAVGRLPGTFMLSAQGAQIYQRDFVGLGLLLLFTTLVALPCYLLRNRLLRRYQGQQFE